MRIFLLLILFYAPLSNGEFSWSAVMRLVLETAKELASTLSKDPAYKTKMYCRELAQFTPQLCDNAVANAKCTEICGEDKTPPGKTFILVKIFICCKWKNNIKRSTYTGICTSGQKLPLANIPICSVKLCKIHKEELTMKSPCFLNLQGKVCNLTK